MVTLKQIAEKAGVSVRTVSVVLNGKECRISAPVKQNIHSIARELRYRPNAMARATRLKRAGQIGVLVCELSNPQTGGIMEAIAKRLTEKGYKLILGLTGQDVTGAEAYLNEFSSGMVDGILNFHPLVDSRLFRKLDVRVPYFHFLRDPQVSIRLDVTAGVNLALNHLYSLGHRRIGFLSGPKVDKGTQERLRAFRAFVKDRLSQPDDLIEYGDWNFESGNRLAPKLLARNCTAILGGDDLIAIGAIKAAQAMGLHVPKDVSIVGDDDSIIALMSAPLLTSVHLPLAEAARLSIDALIGIIQGQGAGKPVLLQPSMVIRESTAHVKKA